MYSAVHVTKSEANKILEVLSLTVAIFFLFITYNDFIFDEKYVFYILTAFSSFTENQAVWDPVANWKTCLHFHRLMITKPDRVFVGFQEGVQHANA